MRMLAQALQPTHLRGALQPDQRFDVIGLREKIEEMNIGDFIVIG